MIADLKPYEEYRLTEGGWLGEVPSHWKTRRMKYVVKEKDSRSKSGKEQLLRVSQYTGVTQRFQMDGIDDPDTRAKSLVGYKLVEPNDLVINIMLAWNGSLGVSLYSGITSPAYCVYCFRSDFSPQYFHYLLRLPIYKSRIKMVSTGVVESRLRLYSDNLFRIEALVPPPAEQAAIVRFLNWANGRLDRAIRAKRKIIRLLEEQKQVIIHQAVTRGLDPDVKLKPTGSRWFPKLPETWEILPLRRVITAAIDGPHFSPQYLDVGIPFLSARNVKSDRWSLNDVKYISEENFNIFSRRVKPELGDVLYTKGGTTGVARAVDMSFPFQVWVHIAVLKVNRQRMDPEFLAFCLNSPRCYEQSQLFTRGATNQDLGLGRMKEIELPVPPTLKEQSHIVSELNSHSQQLKTAISRLEREIDLLREYRTRLIADVVTGKLDVREAAATLPDEIVANPDAEVCDDELIDEEEDVTALENEN